MQTKARALTTKQLWVSARRTDSSKVILKHLPRDLRRLKSYVAPWAVFAGVLIFFAAVYGVPYAFLDDYPMLALRLEHPNLAGFISDLEQFVRDGRLVFGLLLESAYRFTPDVESMRYLRFLSVLGTGLLGALITRLLMLMRWSSAAAGLLAVGIVTLPSYILFCGWTSMWPLPWAALLASSAALCLLRTVRFAGGTSVWRQYTWALLLLVASFEIHQAATATFWFFIAAIWVNVTRKSRAMNRFLLGALGTFFLAAALNFAGMRIPALLGLTSLNPRGQLAQNPIDKVTWFLRSPLRDATNVWNISPLSWLSNVVLAMMLVGLVSQFWTRRYWTAWHGLVAIAFLPLCYTGNLVISEDWSSYRTQAALASTVVLYAGVAFRSVFLRFDPVLKLKRAFFAGALAAFLSVFLLWHAQATLEEYMVLPQMKEWLLVSSAIRNGYRNSMPGTIYIRQPNFWGVSLAPAVRYDEFGLASFYAEWVPMPFTKIAIHGLGVPFSNMPKIAQGRVSRAPTRGEIQIDVDSILRSERQHR